MHVRSWLLASVLIACVEPSDYELPVATIAGSPEPTKFVPKADGIPGEYIVVLRPSHRATIDHIATRHGAIVNKRYASALRGFSARMSEADARALAAEPDV